MFCFHDKIRFYNLYLVTSVSVLTYFYGSSSSDDQAGPRAAPASPPAGDGGGPDNGAVPK